KYLQEKEDYHIADLCGYAYFKLGNFIKSDFLFIKSLSLNSNNLNCLQNALTLYHKTNDFDKFMNIFNKIIIQYEKRKDFKSLEHFLKSIMSTLLDNSQHVQIYPILRQYLRRNHNLSILSNYMLSLKPYLINSPEYLEKLIHLRIYTRLLLIRSFKFKNFEPEEIYFSYTILKQLPKLGALINDPCDGKQVVSTQLLSYIAKELYDIAVIDLKNENLREIYFEFEITKTFGIFFKNFCLNFNEKSINEFCSRIACLRAQIPPNLIDNFPLIIESAKLIFEGHLSCYYYPNDGNLLTDLIWLIYTISTKKYSLFMFISDKLENFSCLDCRYDQYFHDFIRFWRARFSIIFELQMSLFSNDTNIFKILNCEIYIYLNKLESSLHLYNTIDKSGLTPYETDFYNYVKCLYELHIGKDIKASLLSCLDLLSPPLFDLPVSYCRLLCLFTSKLKNKKSYKYLTKLCNLNQNDGFSYFLLGNAIDDSNWNAYGVYLTMHAHVEKQGKYFSSKTIVSMFEISSTLNPNSPISLVNLSIFYHFISKPLHANHQLEMANVIDPEFSLIWYLKCLYYNGSLEQRIKYCIRGLEFGYNVTRSCIDLKHKLSLLLFSTFFQLLQTHCNEIASYISEHKTLALLCSHHVQGAFYCRFFVLIRLVVDVNDSKTLLKFYFILVNFSLCPMIEKYIQNLLNQTETDIESTIIKLKLFSLNSLKLYPFTNSSFILSESTPEINAMLAYSHFKERDFNESIKYLEKSVNNDNIWNAHIFKCIASCYYFLNHFKNSIASLKTAMSYEANDSTFLLLTSIISLKYTKLQKTVVKSISSLRYIDENTSIFYIYYYINLPDYKSYRFTNISIFLQQSRHSQFYLAFKRYLHLFGVDNITLFIYHAYQISCSNLNIASYDIIKYDSSKSQLVFGSCRQLSIIAGILHDQLSMLDFTNNFISNHQLFPLLLFSFKNSNSIFSSMFQHFKNRIMLYNKVGPDLSFDLIMLLQFGLFKTHEQIVNLFSFLDHNFSGNRDLKEFILLYRFYIICHLEFESFEDEYKHIFN
ncbi:hypothetical protein HZS_4571, partial [Henneguya salminicola]